MIHVTRGNLLDAPVEALVNTVNTQGVMGRGIAFQFKQAYPEMFRKYAKACKAGEVQLGKMFVFDLGGLAGNPRWIINFPTKGDWRKPSKLTDIELGLKDLRSTILRLEIRSIAVPPLGCGNGGLDWYEVRPRIEVELGGLTGVDVLLYAPDGSPDAAGMPNRTNRPTMTLGQAALIALMNRYLQGLLDPFISLLEIHKLMYFLQQAGEPLRLQFKAGEYGPYAINLRHLLIRMEKHFTQGYGDGMDIPTKTLELLPGAVSEAENKLLLKPATSRRIERVASLIDGFEDPYGLELLSSVHWVMREDPAARDDAQAAVIAIQDWSDRKRRKLKPEHIHKAWKRLRDQAWDTLLGAV